MGRGSQQNLALRQRLAYQIEFHELQITQSAVDQFGTGGGGVRRKIVLLAQQHLESATRCIACDARAVDASTHDDDIEQG